MAKKKRKKSSSKRKPTSSSAKKRDEAEVKLEASLDEPGAVESTTSADGSDVGVSPESDLRESEIQTSEPPSKIEEAVAPEPERTRPSAGHVNAAREPASESLLAGNGKWVLLALLVAGLGAAYYFSTKKPAVGPAPKRLRAHILERRPHSESAFTQGLLLHDGKLYESTGLEGQSTLREVEIESGEVLRKIDVDAELFAEGLARVDDELIQLTWRKGKAIVYRLSDFEKLREFSYEGEGWGLCYDGTRLIMSDGSATLTFRDPSDFRVIGEVEVTQEGRPVRYLNELECVGGQVYANVWQSHRIKKIDPETGFVTENIDARALARDVADDSEEGRDVLNGIAALPNGHFLLTGKRWPTLFEVEFVEP